MLLFNCMLFNNIKMKKLFNLINFIIINYYLYYY